MRGVIITTEGRVTPLHVKDDESVYDAIFESVGGWIIEVVPTKLPITMYCNEEGKLKRLPRNAVATRLCSIDDVIVGDVVVFGPTDYEGYDTDLGDPEYEYLMSWGNVGAS